MVRHIDLDIAVRNPRDGRFEIVLTDGRTREVVAPDFSRRRSVFAEITLGIAHPRARIYGIAQLLFGEFLSRYIDGFEPLEFLAVGAAANIHLQLVVEDLLLLVGLEVVEIAEIEGEVAVDVLADADGALLPVDDFEGVVFAHSPIHHIEREAVSERVDDRVAFLLAIDEFSLVRRAHIKAATVGAHAVFVVVRVASRQLADGDFVEFYVHCVVFCAGTYVFIRDLRRLLIDMSPLWGFASPARRLPAVGRDLRLLVYRPFGTG